MKTAEISTKKSDYNWEAYKERQENKQHIQAFRGGSMGDNDMKILEVNMAYATYKGEKVRDLDTFKRRKFENLLVISEIPQPITVKYYEHA